MSYHKLRQTSLSDQSGFTIIESLVAILITSILLAAIAPVIVLSVATRVQARRIETATDAAKGYIDGVQNGQITAPSPTGAAATDTLNAYAAPTTAGTLSCNTSTSNVVPSVKNYCNLSASAPTTATNLYCVDLDGDSTCSSSSTQDYVIQAFRYGGTVTSGATTTTITDANKGYQVGIRVYRANAFAGSGILRTTNPKQAAFAAGVGDRKTPLIEMTTEVTTKRVTTFSDFCDRLKPATTNTQSDCS